MNVLLEDATTDEIWDELDRRNFTVFLGIVRVLDNDRIEVWRRSNGSFTMLFGLLKAELLELEKLYLDRDADTGSDDAMGGDHDEAGGLNSES